MAEIKYYKIINGNIVIDTFVTDDAQEYIDKRDEVMEEGLKMEEIDENEYERLEKAFGYISEPRDDDTIRVSTELGKKILLLNFFKEIKQAPSVNKLMEYYKWLSED